MPIPTYFEIRERLMQWLGGVSSLAEFQDWFVLATWEIDTGGSEAASDLAHEISLRLAEFTSGHRSEEELRVVWAPLAQSYVGGDESALRPYRSVTLSTTQVVTAAYAG